MAAKIAFVFILPLLLRASLSLPVSRDGKTVQSKDSMPESGLTERTTVLNLETVVRLQEDNKLKQNLNAEPLLKAFEKFEADHGKRIKRYITKTVVLCPNDRIQCGSYCLTKEQYEDCNDDSEGSDDYEAER